MSDANPIIRSLPFVAVVLAGTLMLGGCSQSKPDPYVGNMHDFSYAGRRDKTYGPSASGGNVRIADFKGKFVWIDYAAPWCGPCVRQSRVIKQLETAHGDRVVFITVLTSGAAPRSAATQRTAEQWARQYGLDPRHVVPSDEWHRTIPQHVVFSPLGQTLDWQVGLKTDSQIRSTLSKHMREWQQWYAENKDSPSVLLADIGE